MTGTQSLQQPEGGALKCPTCTPRVALNEPGSEWDEQTCPTCGGTLLSVAPARRLVFGHLGIHPDSFKGMLLTSVHKGAPCAGCHRPMVIVLLQGVGVATCVHCGMLWLSVGGLEALVGTGHAQDVQAPGALAQASAPPREAAPLLGGPPTFLERRADAPPQALVPQATQPVTPLKRPAGPPQLKSRQPGALTVRAPVSGRLAPLTPGPPAPDGWWSIQRIVVAVALALVFIGGGIRAYNAPDWQGCKTGVLVTKNLLSDGTVLLVCGLADRHEVWFQYDALGALLTEVHRRDGEYDGEYREWTEQRRVMTTGQHKKGKAVGVWTTVLADGSKTIKMYVNGELSGTEVTVRKEGGLLERGQNVRGKKDGMWETRDDSGRITKVTEWRNGELVQSTTGLELQMIKEVPGATTLSQVMDVDRDRRHALKWHVFGGRPASWWQTALEEAHKRGAPKAEVDAAVARLTRAGLSADLTDPAHPVVTLTDATRTSIQAAAPKPGED